MGFLSDAFNWVSETGSDIFKTVNDITSSANFAPTMKGLGALGSAFASYKNGKDLTDLRNKEIDLREEAMQYEIQNAEEEKKRRDKSQAAFESGFESVWG